MLPSTPPLSLSPNRLAPVRRSFDSRIDVLSVASPHRAALQLYRELPLLSSDLRTTTVNVSHSFLRDNKGKPVLSFTIFVNPGNRKEGWRVKKAYSDVLGLDQRIKSSVSTGIRELITYLPGRMVWRDHAPARIDQRKAVLEEYLQSLINLPIRNKDEVIAFLTSDVIRVTPQLVLPVRYKEGYLTKRGKRFGGWKARYFVLQGPVLEYYESQHGTRHGSIVISGAQIGRQQQSDPLQADSDEKEYRHAFFIIEARNRAGASPRQHVLCAESDEERDAWVEVLVRYVTGTYREPSEYTTSSSTAISSPNARNLGRSSASSTDFSSASHKQPNFRNVSQFDSPISKGVAIQLPQLPQDSNDAKPLQNQMNRREHNESFDSLRHTEPSPVERATPRNRSWAESERLSPLTGLNSFPVPDPDGSRVLALLDEVLQQEAKKSALRELARPDAQLLVDYLDWISLQPAARESPAHKQRIKALYRLSKSSQLYPQQYVLRDITRVSVAHGAGGLCDAFPGKYQDQDICLKIVRVYSNKDTSAAMRILAKEAILWGQLCHPNIVPFYGVYYIDMNSMSRACLVSPWMNNGNLNNYFASHPDAPRETLVHDVARGLDYLHQEEIVHGDLKGVNILVSDTGVACITDFGLSSIAGDDALMPTLSTTTVNRVTFRWVSPEVLEGSERGCASDIWALACVFYEILARRLPFHEYKSDAAVLGKVLRGVLPTRPIGEKGETPYLIDDITWALMNQCWAFKPEDRPTCQQILADLKVSQYAIRPQREHLSDANAKFQLAMREKAKTNITPVDLGRVEEILKKL